MNAAAAHLDPLRFPLHGVRLIEASAGTGKTWSITALYLRLVLGHGRAGDEALTPPEILVLTFTRAATQELRDRIRRRLAEAADAFRTGHGGDDEFLCALLADYPDTVGRAACARRLQVAAEWMDEAAVHTIHAWCQGMLRQHAFDSGSLFEQEVDSEDRALFEQVVNDYWRCFLYVRHPLAQSLLEQLPSPQAFSSVLRQLLTPGLSIRYRGRDVAGVAPGALLAKAQAHRQRLADHDCRALLVAWAGVGGQVRTALESALKQGHFYADSNKEAARFKKRFPSVLDALDAWRPGDPLPLDLDLLHARVLLTVSKKNKAPSHPWLDQLSAALDAAPAAPELMPALWAHAVDWVRARYRVEKRRLNRLDFDDLLTQLDQALDEARGPALRRRILEAFPVALIDEFQDTDPVQYRIFERLYQPERDDPRHGLFMIGDPKQSIYAFRGADIYTYLRARSATASEDHFTLPKNHRSTRPMVEAVNALFAAGDANKHGVFGFRRGDDDPVPFLPVASRDRGDRLLIDGQERAPLTFWHQPPEGDGKALAKTAHRPRLAETTAARIARLLDQARGDRSTTGFRSEDATWQPLRPADIAILVNDRHDAALMQRALRQCGVDCVYLSERDSVFDQPEAVDMLAILEAAAQPLDDQRVRNALATASLARSLEELDGVGRDEQQLESEIGLFVRLGRIWRQQGVLAMVRHLLVEKSIPARLLASRRGGERSLTNLLHLAELLQAESDQQEGEQGLIQWFQVQIAREHRSDNDSQVIRLESDADLVRIVTVHKSKGLEFPLVFIPFASCYKTPGSPPFFEYHDAAGDRIAELDTSDAAAKAAGEWEALQERVRLFYVAVTRASHACWVGVAEISGCGDAAPNYLLAKPGLSAGLEQLANASPRIARVEVDDQVVGPQLPGPDDGGFRPEPAREYRGAPRENWWVASYSALRHGAGAASGPEEAQTPIESNLAEMVREQREQADRPELPAREPRAGTIHAFPRGATPGNFLHLLLEWAADQGFAEVLERPQAVREHLGHQLKRRGWSGWTETLEQWLRSQIEAPIALGQSSLRLRDLERRPARYRPELEFWLAADQVDAAAVDALVSRHTLGGRPRIPFEPRELNGMLHGFIDLVFEHQGRWYVADYKSNWLGPDACDYTIENMTETVQTRRYDMQYALYTLALHRLLKHRLGASYRPGQQLGGAVYLFLRGCENPTTRGVFFEPASPALVATLDRLFAGEGADDAG
ncbi:exodeoxyribonuclease V subunit beta [Wenzhouxiangella limi]|uniref:RecBCD enzyme subunit RecB n=1 Tax=Wenzhouxiangella limi TaxID=2707351 RepID=A0A845UYM0_9GAMM|nr:exodeoxyribonuclease V subunit beta [Wenzhouxiangella limi]NDY95818.1 exodeoxyribonuclease V subunit beta [Wenzhouxiangella limi]